MELILMQDVEHLGQMGDEVTVADGYGRNYLIPKGMAVSATDGHRKMVAEHMKLEAKRDELRKSSAEQLAAKLGDLTCTISAQASEEDKLFGSVTTRDIAAALSTDDLQLEHKQIGLDEPIKQLGVYTVPVRLHAEVEVSAKVWVVQETS